MFGGYQLETKQWRNAPDLMVGGCSRSLPIVPGAVIPRNAQGVCRADFRLGGRFVAAGCKHVPRLRRVAGINEWEFAFSVPGLDIVFLVLELARMNDRRPPSNASCKNLP